MVILPDKSLLKMKTLFYQRTAYSWLNVAVPDCFVELDEYFGKLFSPDNHSVILHKSVRLAENICHRMADIEIYVKYISEEL